MQIPDLRRLQQAFGQVTFFSDAMVMQILGIEVQSVTFPNSLIAKVRRQEAPRLCLVEKEQSKC